MGLLKAKTKRQGECVLSTIFTNLNTISYIESSVGTNIFLNSLYVRQTDKIQSVLLNLNFRWHINSIWYMYGTIINFFCNSNFIGYLKSLFSKLDNLNYRHCYLSLLGHNNKIPQTGWLISNIVLFLIVLEGRRLKIKVPVDYVSGESLLPSSCCVFSWWKGQGSCVCLFYMGTNSIH